MMSSGPAKMPSTPATSAQPRFRHRSQVTPCTMPTQATERSTIGTWPARQSDEPKRPMPAGGHHRGERHPVAVAGDREDRIGRQGATDLEEGVEDRDREAESIGQALGDEGVVGRIGVGRRRHQPGCQRAGGQRGEQEERQVAQRVSGHRLVSLSASMQAPAGTFATLGAGGPRVDSPPMQPRLPSPFAILAITVAGLFGILTTARGLVDSDYYWHVTAGRLVAERGVLSTDPFSYTWGGQPWVMHEWLGELIIYWLVSAAGVGIATFVFGVISVSGPLVLAWTLRRMGVAMLPLAAATGLVVYLYASYATIRPQAFSWLFLGILLAGMLTDATRAPMAPVARRPPVHRVGERARAVRHRAGRARRLRPLHAPRPDADGTASLGDRRRPARRLRGLQPDAGRTGRPAVSVALRRLRRLGAAPHLASGSHPTSTIRSSWGCWR